MEYDEAKTLQRRRRSWMFICIECQWYDGGSDGTKEKCGWEVRGKIDRTVWNNAPRILE
jgi:hypothetical protein